LALYVSASGLPVTSAELLGDLRGGWSPGPPAAAPLQVLARLRLATADLAGQAPALSLVETGPGRLEDRGELWHLRFDGFWPGGCPRAEAAVSPRVTDPQLWRSVAAMFLRGVVGAAAAVIDGVLLHGCAMVRPDGAGAVLFVGPSGAGKSSMTRRLPGWRVLADDTALVTRSGAAFEVSGTPLAGKERLPRSGDRVPLERILLLSPGAPVARLAPLDAAEGFAALMPRTMWFARRGPLTERVLATVEALAAALPVARLESSLAHAVAPLLADGGGR
jgi:hypothetical protein